MISIKRGVPTPHLTDSQKVEWLAHASPSSPYPLGFGESPRTLILLLARRINELEERVKSLESDG